MVNECLIEKIGYAMKMVPLQEQKLNLSMNVLERNILNTSLKG